MSGKGKKKALVLGVGNVLLRDDGAGVRAVELIEDSYTLPDGVECVDGGTAGLLLLPSISGYGHIIIIDAIAGERPGAVRKIPADMIPEASTSRRSAHQVGIADLLSVMRAAGGAPEVTLIGITPEDISPGLDLSPAVKNKLPEAARMAIDELSRLGFTPGARRRKRGRCTKPR